MMIVLIMLKTQHEGTHLLKAIVHETIRPRRIIRTNYSSSAVEIDAEVLPELVGNDRHALSEPGTSIGLGSMETSGSSIQLESKKIRASQAFNSCSTNYSDPNVPNGAWSVHKAPKHLMMGYQCNLINKPITFQR